MKKEKVERNLITGEIIRYPEFYIKRGRIAERSFWEKTIKELKEKSIKEIPTAYKLGYLDALSELLEKAKKERKK